MGQLYEDPAGCQPEAPDWVTGAPGEIFRGSLTKWGSGSYYMRLQYA